MIQVLETLFTFQMQKQDFIILESKLELLKDYKHE